MNKYKMIISYDGKNYFGYQIQNNKKTIQQALEDALKIIFRKKIKLVASGRTDRGVHAKAQVCHFTIEEKIDEDKILYKLNRMIDEDIKILSISKINEDFHARFSAISKIYHYHICLKNIMPPHLRLYAHRPIEKIDINLLKEATKHFIGTKDFTSFSNKKNEGACKNNPIRTLKRIDIKNTDYGIRLEFEGDGFLYKMVRNIVSLLLDIASKKKKIEEIEGIFLKRDRTFLGKAAPAHALFLEQVIYDKFYKNSLASKNSSSLS